MRFTRFRIQQRRGPAWPPALLPGGRALPAPAAAPWRPLGTSVRGGRQDGALEEGGAPAPP